MLGSNQRPLPCEGRSITPWLFADVQKHLQNCAFYVTGSRACSPLFVWVGVLMHLCREGEGVGPRTFPHVFLPTRAIARLYATTTTSRAIRALAAWVMRVRSPLAAASGCIISPTSRRSGDTMRPQDNSLWTCLK